ncbi:hypothetical protein MP228_006146 [Amoeboaphelidium protococcarum]|nr:hypothetical protein MP228_006146 [Amoeboaphelidium protococcarum]
MQSDYIRWIQQNGKFANIKELIFFGTGTSGGVPSCACLTDPAQISQEEERCRACWDAYENPLTSKNARNNTSAVVRILDEEGVLRNILIDCGKTFYNQSIRWCPKYNIRRIDAVLLTHSHADAMLGMDDLRQWTLPSAKAVNKHKPSELVLKQPVQQHIDIYLNSDTFRHVNNVFPYLVDKKFASGGGDVAGVKFHHLVVDQTVDGVDLYVPIKLFGITIQPLSVEHGKLGNDPFYCLGYKFIDRDGSSSLVYISDASKVPDMVEKKYLCPADGAEQFSLMVIDALHDKPHPSHFNIEQALQHLSKYKVDFGLLTGFSHRVEHSLVQQRLDQECNQPNISDGRLVYAAFDGLCVKL